ncbi:hypothetical protein Ae201684P_005300 [Aphanomyces euteiches]|nr:hypothetical protein Ae201684P_005300 [Aphanomyces euteiches]
MVEFFGDKRGLGHIEYGSNTPSNESQQIGDASSDSPSQVQEELNDELQDESEHTKSKRKREISQELHRQRQAHRQKKADVASGLVTMGEVLAKGLVDAAICQAIFR